MLFNNFKDKVISQDSRNRFGVYHGNIDFIPLEFQYFYINFNPEDVEVLMRDFNAVKFYPVAALDDLQKDYDLGELAFIFATKNSDPIFANNGRINTVAHGGNNEYEEIASDFNSYIDCIMINMM